METAVEYRAGCLQCKYVETIKTLDGQTYHCMLKPMKKNVIGWNNGVAFYIEKPCEKFEPESAAININERAREYKV